MFSPSPLKWSLIGSSLLLLFSILLFVVEFSSAVKVPTRIAAFQVRPNTPEEYTLHLPNTPYSCRFSWSCVGGTGEEWEIKLISRKRNTQVTCTIQRAGGTPSYLYFMSFEAQLEGAEVKDATVLGENGKIGFTSTPTSVKNQGGWSGMLNSIQLTNVKN